MEELNKKRLILGVSIFLLIAIYLFKNLSITIRVLGFTIGICIFYFLDNMFGLDYKLKHYFYAIIILSFGILASPFYFLSELYDKALHFILPILGSCLIFHIVDRQKVNMQWKLLITFMFIISFLAIHEVGEYLLDILWDMKLQGVYVRDVSGFDKLNLVMSKNDDTMIDIILGMAGAVIYAIWKVIIHLSKELKKERKKKKSSKRKKR